MTLFEFTVLDHIMAMVICLIAPIFAITTRNFTTEDIQLDPGEKIRLYHSNALLLLVFSLIVLTIWRLPGRTLEDIGFQWPVWNDTVLQLIVAVFVFYALDVFFQYGTKKWRTQNLKNRAGSMAFVPANHKELRHFILLALAAGIGEEIIFRGFLLHYLIFWTGNDLIGIITAVVLGSALFAFLHGYQGIRSMIKIFFLSLLLSGIFIYSESLILVMAIHTIIDFISGWMGIHLLKLSVEEDSND